MKIGVSVCRFAPVPECARHEIASQVGAFALIVPVVILVMLVSYRR
jgi:hypothetical protein